MKKNDKSCKTCIKFPCGLHISDKKKIISCKNWSKVLCGVIKIDINKIRKILGIIFDICDKVSPELKEKVWKRIKNHKELKKYFKVRINKV